jgi:acetylornithine deacetylase/succinyl-diaminopimelate desuccinylase-like protein
MEQCYDHDRILTDFGPERVSVHAPDEWMRVSNLAETVAVYAGVIAEWSGLTCLQN